MKFLLQFTELFVDAFFVEGCLDSALHLATAFAIRQLLPRLRQVPLGLRLVDLELG